MELKTVILHGGPRDGREAQVWAGQPMLYLPLRVTIEQSELLRIGETQCWKHPECVYVLRDGAYCFDRVQHYCPDDVPVPRQEWNE